MGLTSSGQEEADATALTDCKRERPLGQRHRRWVTPVLFHGGWVHYHYQQSLVSAGTEDEQTYRVTQENKPSQRHSGQEKWPYRGQDVGRDKDIA